MLTSYLKIAIKVLCRRKFFTFISLFGIAFTLMVLLVFTAVVDDLFGTRPPEVLRDRTLELHQVVLSGPRNDSSGPAGFAFIERYVRDLPHVEAMTVFQDHQTVTSYDGGRRIQSALKRTDAEFWEVYAFDFLEGAAFDSGDAEAGRFVAVINRTTRKRFFGEGEAVGRDISADGQTFRVIGVVEDVPMTRRFPFGEIWVPVTTSKSTGYRHQIRGDFRAAVIARDRADFPQIKAELAARLAEAEPPDPERYDTMTATLDTPWEDMSRGLFTSDEESNPTLLKLLLILGMVLFMLLPTVNLVNLNLSRIMERASEIGVRKSFGASSLTLVGQFVVENVVLTLIGGAMGWVLAGFGLRLINAAALLPYARFELNLPVLGYGVLLALFFGLLSGVYPAWRMSRLDPVQALSGRKL